MSVGNRYLIQLHSTTVVEILISFSNTHWVFLNDHIIENKGKLPWQMKKLLATDLCQTFHAS